MKTNDRLPTGPSWRVRVAAWAGALAASLAASAATHTVQAVGIAFVPQDITIDVGDTIRWTGLTGHTTTSGAGGVADGVWDSGSQVSSFDFTFNEDGVYPYFCRPHFFLGMVGTVTVRPAANVPPTVALTSPAEGATFTAPATVTLEASANDTDGTVTEVEFYDGATELGGDTTSPYSLTVNLAEGTHVLTAVAVDNQGAETTSATVTVTVTAPAPIQLSGRAGPEANLVLEWSGGAGPFAVQKRTRLEDPQWHNSGFTAQRTATVPMGGAQGLFRVVDLASQPAVPFTAHLSGLNERPNPLTNNATGSGTFSLEGDTLMFDVQYRGLSGTATRAHIHGPAAASGAAGVIIDMEPFNGGAFGDEGTFSGAVALTPEQRAMVLAGQTYFNIHTAANPGGEVRGQIAPVLWQASLGGANERPDPLMNAGFGSGTFTLVGNRLSFNLMYGGLSGPATRAHIHGPATLEQAASVLVDLEPFNGGAFGAAGSLAGAVTLTPEQLAHLLDGLTYVNVHTGLNPGGEIRGQLLPQATAVPLTAWLSGLNERPDPLTNDATGTATFALEGDRLTFNLRYAGLSGPATRAHIHGPASAQESVGVLIDLEPFNGGGFGAAGTVSGTVTLTPEQRTHLLSGRTYVNFHTADKPAGELRGQIAPVLMRASLNGASERPTPVVTGGVGSGAFTLVWDQLAFNLTYRGLSGVASAAHIHGPASAEDSAGVLLGLAPFNGGAFGSAGSLFGTASLTATQLGHVVDGNTYVNFHTAANPDGEIRGQITR